MDFGSLFYTSAAVPLSFLFIYSLWFFLVRPDSQLSRGFHLAWENQSGVQKLKNREGVGLHTSKQVVGGIPHLIKYLNKRDHE